MPKLIKIRLKLDSSIKTVAVETKIGVITTDGKFHKRSDYHFEERIWCHYCRNNDEVVMVDTAYGKRATCRSCKPKNCCSVPGCTESIHSIHSKSHAFCYVHFRKSIFFNMEEDPYDGISDEGVIASERLWMEISNRRKYSKEEIAQYEQLLESYRVHPARW